MRSLPHTQCLLVVSLCVSAACFDRPGKAAVFIELELDEQTCGPCQSVPLTCTARFGLRVVDRSDPGNVTEIDNDCSPAMFDGQGICGVRPTVFEFEAPPKTLQFQAAVWRTDLVGGSTCPSVSFDANGRALPLQAGVNTSEAVPPPAIAGAIDWPPNGWPPANDDYTIRLKMYCNDAAQLAQNDCPGATVSVDANLLDMDDLVDVASVDIDRLDVQIGLPTSKGDVFEVLAGAPPTGNTRQLTHAGRNMWFSDDTGLNFEVSETACIIVRETAGNEGVTCTRVGKDFGSLSLQGLFLRTSLVQEILATEGVNNGLPPQGFVIGRVVSHFKLPMAGVRVTAKDNPSVIVRYLNDQFAYEEIDGKPALVETGASGYFFSPNAPFATQWLADRPSDNRRQNGDFRGGLIENRLSLVLIELTPPLGEI